MDLESLEVPRMLYRAGGAHVLESGAYSLQIVPDLPALEAAIADGWHLDQYAAKDAAAALQPDAEPPAQTRAEMEAEAKVLGIKVDKRWGDARLAAEIAEAKG